MPLAERVASKRQAKSDMHMPLWKLLQSTAKSLLAIEKGQSWATVADTVDANVRSGTHALLYAVLRNWWLGQALENTLLKKAGSLPARASALLRIASVLLTAQRGMGGAQYDAHTVVNQAVEAARRNAKTRHVAGVINACLRRLLRERDTLLPALMQRDTVRFNLPLWWLQRLQNDWHDDWQTIADWQRTTAPLTLRVNAARVTLADYLRQLEQEGIAATAAGGCAVVLHKPPPIEQLPGYRQGWFAVQDAAAQLAAPLLLDSVFATTANGSGNKVSEPLHVLDACAAPGGKTAHLLAYAEQHGRAIDLLALEVDALRSQRIQENLHRLRHTSQRVQISVADAADTASWYPAWREHSQAAFFDAVLLDAPCSAAGVVRRHPDIPLLRRDHDLAALAAQQKRLLEALWPFVRAGGCLLYCTCSLFKAEGQEQVQTFLENNSGAQLLPAPGQLLSINTHNSHAKQQEGTGMPHNISCEHDAFYYALLRKSAACSFG